MYKFKKKNKDKEILMFQTEIEDNFSTQFKSFQRNVPSNLNYKNGDTVAYSKSGTHKIYFKIDGNLYSVSLTKE